MPGNIQYFFIFKHLNILTLFKYLLFHLERYHLYAYTKAKIKYFMFSVTTRTYT